MYEAACKKVQGAGLLAAWSGLVGPGRGCWYNSVERGKWLHIRECDLLAYKFIIGVIPRMASSINHAACWCLVTFPPRSVCWHEAVTEWTKWGPISTIDNR